MNKRFSLFFVLTIFFSLCVESIHAQRICNGMGSSEALPTKCFEIENILVDACGPDEGYDEMVRIRIGPNPLTLNSINNIDWPNTSNSWLGWATYNSSTLSKLSTINNLIAAAGNCGRLIKLNPNDVAPAYSRILIITSTIFSTSAHDFSGLKDTLYVALQNNTTQFNGHFANNPPSARTLIISTNTCGDTVTYFGNLMVKLNGTPGSEDGSGVRFSYNGTASYYNYGCALPNNLFTVDAGVIPGSYCSGASVPIQGSISGNACYYWYPQNRNSGTVTDSTKLNTTFNVSPSFSGSVKLYLVAYGNCSTIKDSVIFNVNPATTSINITALANSNWCNRKTIPLSAISGSPNSVIWSSTGMGTFTNSNSLNTAYVPSINDTGNIWIRVNQILSCGVAKDSIRVYLTPSPSAHFSPVDTLFCLSQAGSVVSLNPQKVGGTFYSNFVTGTNFTVPNVAGIYSVKYLISLNGCSDSVTKSMHVQSQPNAFFTLSDTLICLGSKNITISPQASGGIYSGITIIGNTFTPTTSGTYILTHKIISGNCVDSFSRTIYVLPKPNAAFTVSDTSLCEGNLATFTPAIAGGFFSGSYVNGNVFTSVISGVFSVNYTLTQNGCSDSTQRSIYVNAKPNAFFTLSDTLICLGSKNITITPQASGGIFSGITIVGNTYTPTTSGTYILTHKIVSGNCVDSFSRTIYVLPKPNAAFTVSDTLLCEGNLATFTPAVAGGFFSGSYVNGNVFTSVISGVFSVNYTLTQNGCIDSTQRSIYVNSKPNAFFTLSDTLICLGSKNITISPQASGGIYSGITIVGNTYTPTTSGTYILTHKIVSGNCVDSFSRTIYVLPKPNAAFTVSDTSLCEGNLATFTPAVAGGFFSGSYVNGNVFTSVISGVFPVKYTITQNGCIDSTQQLIYVDAKPDASFSASDTILCKGALDIILTPNYAGGIFYGTGVIGDKFNYHVPGKYEVTYVINNKSCSDSSTKFILVNDNPDADFSLSDSILCVGDLPLLIVPKTIGGIFTGIVIKDNKFNPSVSGIYYVNYELVVNGCKDSTTKKITVFAKPNAKFSVTPNPVITFDSAFFTYTGGSVVNKYSWSFGDGKSSILSNPVHVYDKGNSYQVWLTVANSDGCLDSIVEIVLVEDDDEVFIPNVFTPNDDLRNDIFKLIITTAKDFSMTIYNRWGGLVFESNNFNVGWDGISNGVICPEGVYVYVVTFKNARGLEKKLHGTLTLIR